MQNKLKGQYGFPVAVSMVVGIVIGIGIFFKTGQILEVTEHNTAAAITAWVLGGIISVISGLTVAEIGAAIPETGGTFAWIKKIYGNRLAFALGWAQVTIYNSALIALIAYYFAHFSIQLLGLEQTTILHALIAFSAMLFLFFINVFTKNLGGKLQTIMTVAKIIPIFLIIIFGFLHENTTHDIITTTSVIKDSESSFFTLVTTALLPIMFAFDGWIYVGTIAGDLKNPKKDLPKAIILGISFIAVVYILLNIALLNVFTPEKLIEVGMFGAAVELFGSFGSKLVYSGIVISAFGGLNGFILISTRVPYSLAVEGLFPKSNYFSKISKKYQQPLRSSFLMLAISATYLFVMFYSGEVDAFGDVPVALIWVFYTIIFVGVFVLRKKQPDLERPYKVPFYPVIPILAVVGGLAVGVSAFISNPYYFGLSILVTLSGMFFYKKS
ncbi:MAG: amino acid permease [Ichthyobacteriaceae bacterium]|nr:amino acid permease [Ichthyobacteriaceae bacterium]